MTLTAINQIINTFSLEQITKELERAVSCICVGQDRLWEPKSNYLFGSGLIHRIRNNDQDLPSGSRSIGYCVNAPEDITQDFCDFQEPLGWEISMARGVFSVQRINCFVFDTETTSRIANKLEPISRLTALPPEARLYIGEPLYRDFMCRKRDFELYVNVCHLECKYVKTTMEYISRCLDGIKIV